jgi:hypothetical protein
VELAKHEQGNYLIQKLADHAEPQELVDLCSAVFPQVGDGVQRAVVGSDPIGAGVGKGRVRARSSQRPAT